ncbi:ATP-binding protein [Amycolatopsis sp. NPDC004747]
MSVRQQSEQSGDNAQPAAVTNSVVAPAVSGTVLQVHTINGGLHHHPVAAARPVPRQLPPAPAGFVGRAGQLAELDHRGPASPAGTSPPAHPTGRTPMISAISGAGGIGKSWLALTWAHRSLDRFPDGQLFADLRGYSPTESPARPFDVLGEFLDALGVDHDRRPADLNRRAGLYRSLVADKRMLVVLDNAAEADQVVPLLPGGQHCRVLVAGRDRLHGLVARHGARPVHLDVFTGAEARTVLAAALAPGRAADEQAIAELVGLCGGFPLALGLVAARVAATPRLPLRETAAELRDLGLAALDSAEPTASLPAVLSWSLRRLDDRQRRVFALLGVMPGPDIGLLAATHLTGLPKREAQLLLRALADASLVDRVPGGRYGMHDLVRGYATSVADEMPAETTEAALRRVLAFYTYTAHTADIFLDAHRDHPRIEPPDDGADVPQWPDTATAMAWFETEHACLLAAQRAAGVRRCHDTVWQLAWCLDTFHYRLGLRHDRLAVWQAAAEATAHLADVTVRIRAHRFLGRAHSALEHHRDAISCLDHALGLAETHHARKQQGLTHRTLAYAWANRGDDERAGEHDRKALAIFRELGEPLFEAEALNSLACQTAGLGETGTARSHCQAALALWRQNDDPYGEAISLTLLANLDHRDGLHADAVTRYRQALDLFHDLRYVYAIADVLDNLGRAHRALGQVAAAGEVWREALRLYREQGRADSEAGVQRQLDELGAEPARAVEQLPR